MKRAPIGPISSYTMRPEDLIPTFTDWLEDLDADKAFTKLIEEARGWIDYDPGETTTEDEEDDHEEGADFILEELFDALDSFSPPHCYFGAQEGDGACYGWWISDDSIRDDIHDGFILKVSDLSEVPPDYTGEVLHVNDHGNATLYTAQDGKLEEVWGVV